MYTLTTSERFAVIAMVKERDRIAEAYQEAQLAITDFTKHLADTRHLNAECRLALEDGVMRLIPVLPESAQEPTGPEQ